MAGFADSTREGGFAGAAGAGTSSSAGTSSGGGLANSTREGGFAAGSNVGGGGNGGAGNRPTGGLAGSTREGGFAGAGVASLSRSAQAQRPTVSPGAGNVASGGVAGLKNATGFFSGAAKVADYDTIQKAIVASGSPLDAFGLNTLTPFGVKAYSFQNDLNTLQQLQQIQDPTAAQKKQLAALQGQLTADAKALQAEAATISGLPEEQAAFAAWQKSAFPSMRASTYGLNISPSGVGTAPGYDVIGPMTLGGYPGAYLGLSQNVPTMVQKAMPSYSVADFTPSSGIPGAVVGRNPNESAVAFSNDQNLPPATGMLPAMQKAGYLLQTPDVTWGTPQLQAAKAALELEAYKTAQPILVTDTLAPRVTGTPSHPAGLAVDFSLYDPVTGQMQQNIYKTVDGQQLGKSYGGSYGPFDPTAFRNYEKVAQGFSQNIANMAPQYADAVRWGGYFGPSGTEMDLMHLDFSGKPGLGMLGGSFEQGLLASQASRYPGVSSSGIGSLSPAQVDVAQTFPEEINPVPLGYDTVFPKVPGSVVGRNPNEGFPATTVAAIPGSVVGRNPNEGFPAAAVAAVPGGFIGRDPYAGVPAPSGPIQITNLPKPGAPATPATPIQSGSPAPVTPVEVSPIAPIQVAEQPQKNPNFFGALMGRFNNFKAGPSPMQFASRGEGERKKEPVASTVTKPTVVATTSSAPAQTGLVWDFESGTTPVVYERPDVYAQYRALFAQPVPVSTGVGSLLPTIEVVPPKA